MKLVILATALALVAPSVAMAKSKDAPDASDPNRVICRTEGATGTRLGSQKKRCMTAQEWAEAKRIDRLDIEKVQAGRYKND